METGERRRTVLADTGSFARLVDALPNMDFSMSMGNPTDVPIENIYVHVFGEMVRQSNKPICFIANSGRDMRHTVISYGCTEWRLHPGGLAVPVLWLTCTAKKV